MSTRKPVRHACANCAFFACSVWKPVGAGGVSHLARALFRREVAAGEVLFHQGSSNRGIYRVSKGLFGVRAMAPCGTTTLLRMAYPGELIGFRSFIRKQGHQTEARAMIPSRVCVVSRRDAEQLITTAPDVLSRLTLRCIDEIDRSQARFISSATLTSRQRVVGLLLKLIALHGAQNGDRVDIRLPISRGDMADMLGVQPETVSRLISRLQDDRLIEVSGRSITVPSLKALGSAGG